MKSKLLRSMLSGVLALAAAWPAAAQWQPSERITFLIGVPPGGSADMYARGIAERLESLKLTHGQPVIAENKGGAGGALALQQLRTMTGNAHWLGTFHTATVPGAVTGLIRADPRDFRPVAMMVEETILVAVRTESPLKDGKDLVKTLKADPTKLRIGVAPGVGMHLHLALAKPLQMAGVDVGKLTVAGFRSSAESVTALLGGHIDVVSATAPLLLPHVASGKLRLLASAAPEHGIGALASVKTWRELGIPADYVSYNGVMLPPGVTADQLHFWENALRRVSQDKAWIRLVEQSGNKPIFRGPADSHRYLMSEWDATTELVKQLNLGDKR